MRLAVEQILEILGLAGAILLRSLDSLRQNRGVGILAIAIAAVMWVVVSIEQNPPRTETFGEPVPVRVVNVPPGLYVFGEVPAVRVRVTAPADVWERLSVRDFTATIDLQNAAVGVGEYTVRVEARDNRIRVLAATPQAVPVRLEVSRSKVIPIRPIIQGTVPLGFAAEAPQIGISEAVVQGPQSLIEQVTYAAVVIDLQDRRVDVNQSLPLTSRNEQGYEILGVSIDPNNVPVRLRVRQQVFYRTVPLVATTEGTPPAGFNVSGITLDPSTVTVVGAQRDLEAISRLETRPIPLSAARMSFSTSPQVSLPPGVSLAGEQPVLARVEITPVIGQRILELVPVPGVGSPPNAILPSERVRVLLAGPVQALDALDPASLRAVVDAAGLVPGTHRLPVRVAVPESIRVISITPEQIPVTIEP